MSNLGKKGTLMSIFGKHSRVRGFPTGECPGVADDIEKLLHYPRVNGWIAIGIDHYSHSWNRDGEDIIEGGTAHQFNGLLQLSGIPGFIPGPQRIRPGDLHYRLYITKRRGR